MDRPYCDPMVHTTAQHSVLAVSFKWTNIFPACQNKAHLNFSERIRRGQGYGIDIRQSVGHLA